MAAQWGEAAQLWTAHIRTAQTQMAAAIDDLIAGFRGILAELDAALGQDPGLAADGGDRPSGVLAPCEQRLHKLIDRFKDIRLAGEGALHGLEAERVAATLRTAEVSLTEVLEQLRGMASALHLRTDALSARSAAVLAQVQQLMVAFQFQDRVQQILDQVCDSIAVGVASLQASLHGAPLSQGAAWTALISAGYTTPEQHAVNPTPAELSAVQRAPRPSGGASAAASASAAAPAASIETTFF